MFRRDSHMSIDVQSIPDESSKYESAQCGDTSSK